MEGITELTAGEMDLPGEFLKTKGLGVKMSKGRTSDPISLEKDVHRGVKG